MISTGRGWSGHFLAGTTSLFFATARWWHTRRTFGFVDLAQKRELQWSERKEKKRKWYHRSSKINLPTHWIGKKSVKKSLKISYVIFSIFLQNKQNFNDANWWILSCKKKSWRLKIYFSRLEDWSLNYLILFCPESGWWVIIKNIVKHSRN